MKLYSDPDGEDIADLALWNFSRDNKEVEAAYWVWVNVTHAIIDEVDRGRGKSPSKIAANVIRVLREWFDLPLLPETWQSLHDHIAEAVATYRTRRRKAA